MDPREPAPGPSAVLVCGLGRLGQSCVAALRPFHVPLRGIDLQPHNESDDVDWRGMLESLSVGDCRAPETLRRAGADACRSTIIVTGDERINIAAAMAVRSLNPQARIVVRSGQQNLNRFLSSHLGNFVALEPTHLSAPALALAALGDETLGLFPLEGELVRVLRHTLGPKHPWSGRRLHDIDGSRRRVLSCTTAGHSRDFDEWTPDEPMRAGDAVTCVELGPDRGAAIDGAKPLGPTVDEAGTDGERSRWRFPVDWREAIATRWSTAPQIGRVAIVAAFLILSLYLSCALLYRLQYPEIGIHDALNVAMVLILGGFDNVFGQLKLPFPIPGWLHAFSVLVSVSGTVGIGIVYAFLTERVLSVQFQFFLRRPKVPTRGHVVLVGLGPLAGEVADLLMRWRRPVAAVGASAGTSGPLARIPVVGGPLEDAMKKVRLSSARCLVALGDDDVGNLEAALTARAMSARVSLVVRADDAHFRENVAQLVTGARVLGVQALAADAFAAAAFGENIHQLLHVDGRTLLVTEYHVEPIDTLHGRLVGEVAYGYGVLPLVLSRDDSRSTFFPSDDIRLRDGDRLVVLAAVDALRRIEQAQIVEPSFRVQIDVSLSRAAGFDAAMTLARVTGCDIARAQELTKVPPSDPALPISTPLYAQQADRLVRELAKIQVSAHVVEPPPPP